MASSATSVREAGVGELAQLRATLADAFATDPIIQWLIPNVGVAAGFQEQGLGTASLRPTLDRCDRERPPAYLEASSERSAELYERLGFVHLGELRVPGGPPFWPMRRPPAAA